MTISRSLSNGAQVSSQNGGTYHLPNDEEKTNPDPSQDTRDPNLVDWDGEDDPENPLNWSSSLKIFITFQLGMLAMAGSLGSAIVSPANDTIARYVGVSEEVGVLSVSLYILGFALGPLCWAPIGEIWGRKLSILPAMFGLAIFTLGTGLSKNATSLFITRFFAGVFGSAPISNVSAALGDIYSPAKRGTAVTFYSCGVVAGPTLGPTIGAAILVNRHLGWRWTAYIEVIWVITVSTLSIFCLPEMYAPVLLKRKAQQLRKSTGNKALYHPHESIKIDPKTMVTKHFSRPLRMLVTEPMVTCIAFYASFVYGVLYLTLPVFPIVFSSIRQWEPVRASLPQLGLFIGVLCAVPINLINQPRYARLVASHSGEPVPEGRLLPMAIGGFLFSIGLFWFGWTATPPSIHWASPAFAAAFIGGGFIVIFQQCINFLVDTYAQYSASAVASNTFLRSFLAAGLPMAAGPMYSKLGVGPATSIIGAVSVMVLPVPFLFMKYGVRLRARSRFALGHKEVEKDGHDI